jgi:branched-chain amino acid transport system ATP-binding protein
MAILSLHSVSKSFGALKVTDDVSFDLAPGEALGIIGPNGAGKSTLFNLITGNIRADAGRVFLDGRDVTRLPPMERCAPASAGRSRSRSPSATCRSMKTCWSPPASAARSARPRRRAFAWASCHAPALPRWPRSPRAGCRCCSASGWNWPARWRPGRASSCLDEIAGGLTDAECVELIATIRPSMPRAPRSSGSSMSCMP